MMSPDEELNIFLESRFNSSIASSYSKKDRQVKIKIDSSTFNKIVSCLENNS